MSNYICPAEISAALASQLAQSSLAIHNLLGCRHYSRVDYRLSPEGSFFCLEVNTLPGLTDTSLVPKAAAVVEISFKDLVLKLCTMALHGR
jgi:D-alanine-D-alanine ligase